MSGNVIATAWIHVQPEMKGIRGEISGEVEKELDRSESGAKASGQKAGQGFSAGFKSAAGAIAGFLAAAGIGELAQQAAETDMAMSKLSASAAKNGVGAQAMENAYSGLVGVIGETDRSVETAGNMFALCGDNQKQLESLTTSLTGAFSQFGDGLPIESLAEAA